MSKGVWELLARKYNATQSMSAIVRPLNVQRKAMLMVRCDLYDRCSRSRGIS
jgi:hypothetical protein